MAAPLGGDETIKRGTARYNSQTGAWEMIERGVTRYNPQTGVWEWEPEPH